MGKYSPCCIPRNEWMVQMYGWRRGWVRGWGVDGVWLSAAVKAGNAGFWIESYGIFVSQILGTFLICSSCFVLNGPLRQYFSLYRAVSQREGERTDRREKKMSKQPPPAPTASTVGPCPTIIQISRTPRHWKFTQRLRATRPPTYLFEIKLF